MKLVFAGTPPFAARALLALVDAGHEVALVLTQPDRAAGRGLHAQASAVAQSAAERGLALAKPPTLKDDLFAARLRALDADVLVVAAYGLLVPPPFLAIPRLGCINIHASLLPRWRGAAPIQRAIEAGDHETGISIMQMDAGLDTGAVLNTWTEPILADDTSATLLDKLTELGAQAIVDTLVDLPKWTPQVQPVEGACYAAKIQKSEAPINWSLPASLLERRIRAFDPFPGCETHFSGQTIKFWAADVDNEGTTPVAPPGTVIALDDGSIAIQCGQGHLRPRILQRAGGKRLDLAAFQRGFALTPGMVAT